MVSAVASQAISFIANMATSYILSRLSAQDGPRLENREASSGEYGVPMPRGHGSMVRLTGAVIAQDEIEEHEHKVEDYSEIVGAIGGAASGFMLGGPIGAVIGGAVGGLLGFGTPDQKYYTYTNSFACFLLDRTFDDPIEGLWKVIANGKKVFEANPANIVIEELDADGRLIRREYKKNKWMKALTIYGGHPDQNVDPNLEFYIDEDNAYIYSAYVVIEDLQLGPFGNSLPATEYLVQVKTNESLAEAAESFALASGIDPERDISTTALNDITLGGYLLTSEITGWDALKPLMPVYAVDAAEVAGQIRFYQRSQYMRSTFVADDMGAYAFGDSPPEKYQFRRDTDLNLPQATSLTFVDPARDYLSNTATSTRSEGNANSNVSVSLNLALSASEGASAAALMHWDAWLGRTQLNFTLTDSWLSLATGHAYGIPVGGEILPYRITRKTRGANGIIEVEALSDESITYTANVAGASGEEPVDESTDFPETRLILIDGPLLQDGHDDYGYYIVMGGEAGWTRGLIQISADGINFPTVIDQPFMAAMGDVTGTLAAGTTTGLDDTLDTTTELIVETISSTMTFESATDDELDNWKNFGFVGKDGIGEYLQWKTPTQLGPTTWKLTNLRRGRRGTDWAIGTHTSGEEFADLTNGEGVYRIVYSDTSKWGEEFTYRGVTLHQTPEDADEQTFTNTGEGKRPFSPVNVEGTWDGSNNLTATFEDRSRLFAGGLGIDDNYEFDVEITNATPVRTITVTAETFNYSAADQTTDGLTPGTVVEGRVRQTSDVNDGRWREFTLYGPLASTADSTLILADTTLLTADMA
jgi:hypothetical protein